MNAFTLILIQFDAFVTVFLFKLGCFRFIFTEKRQMSLSFMRCVLEDVMIGLSFVDAFNSNNYFLLICFFHRLFTVIIFVYLLLFIVLSSIFRYSFSVCTTDNVYECNDGYLTSKYCVNACSLRVWSLVDVKLVTSKLTYWNIYPITQALYVWALCTEYTEPVFTLFFSFLSFISSFFLYSC